MTLRRLAVDEIRADRRPVLDPETLNDAREILDEVERDGDHALRRLAEQFGDRAPGQPLLLDRTACEAALASLPAAKRDPLERAAARIREFATAQRGCLTELDVEVPGGRAGHSIAPVGVAGCYAPGGRYPLPSSVLMTAVTARVAGVERVIVASPRPAPATLAAAAIAGADAVLAVGGAHAIGALAFGTVTPPADVIVGPGNRWVTAAKQLLSGRVLIDMVAGPSELVVIADESADPRLVAADLLGQAEHDDDALPILITTSAALADAVDAELVRQLETLPTAPLRRALANGYICVTGDLDAAFALSDRLAPEHLQLMTADAVNDAERVHHFGGLFVGSCSAEVFGDYGAGPNHVLPTGGAARAIGGLSVMQFLRVRTWLRIERDAPELVADASALARIEGLEAHARAATARS